jgi:metal-responsive CopG/Arc/MetJ family transcriptional regulator
MKKKKTQIMIPINIRLPLRLIEDVDEVSSNRSHYIRHAIRAKLSDDRFTVQDASPRQLMAALANHPNVEPILADILMMMIKQGYAE